MRKLMVLIGLMGILGGCGVQKEVTGREANKKNQAYYKHTSFKLDKTQK